MAATDKGQKDFSWAGHPIDPSEESIPPVLTLTDIEAGKTLETRNGAVIVLTNLGFNYSALRDSNSDDPTSVVSIFIICVINPTRDPVTGALIPPSLNTLLNTYPQLDGDSEVNLIGPLSFIKYDSTPNNILITSNAHCLDERTKCALVFAQHNFVNERIPFKVEYPRTDSPYPLQNAIFVYAIGDPTVDMSINTRLSFNR